MPSTVLRTVGKQEERCEGGVHTREQRLSAEDSQSTEPRPLTLPERGFKESFRRKTPSMLWPGKQGQVEETAFSHADGTAGWPLLASFTPLPAVCYCACFLGWVGLHMV